jgi:hypothetical protein
MIPMPLVLTCAVRAAAMHGMSEFPGLKTVSELEEEIIMIFQYQHDYRFNTQLTLEILVFGNSKLEVVDAIDV